MKTGKGTRIALLSAIAMALPTVLARADEPAQPDTQMAAKIAELQQQLDQLKLQQAEQQKEIQQKDNVAAEAGVISDADRRSKTFDITGVGAGYANGRFYLQSDDGNFVWRPWLHFQLRDITMDREDFKSNKDDEIDNGFEIRRMRFGFDGNMFTPDLTYFFNWATVRANGNATVKSSTGATVGTVSNNLGGAPLLEEAWVKYNFHDTPFYVKGGQIKDPIDHEQILSSRYQQSTERSLTANMFFNGDAFTEGVTFIYDPHTFVRTEAGVNHGLRSANTNFLDYSNTNAFNYGLVARAEFKFWGNWKDYSQMGAVGIKESYLVAGIGCDYSERGHAGQYVGGPDITFADPSGLFLYGSYTDRYTTSNFGAYTQSPTGASIITPNAVDAGHPTNEYSILGQVGYCIDQHWEPFGRYEIISVKGTASALHQHFQDITGGVNYYFFGHRAKLTAQLQFLPTGINFDDGPSDILTSSPGKAELMGEVQFQLLI